MSFPIGGKEVIEVWHDNVREKKPTNLKFFGRVSVLAGKNLGKTDQASKEGDLRGIPMKIELLLR